MSESSTSKKTTRSSSRRGPDVPDEPEADNPARDEADSDQSPTAQEETREPREPRDGFGPSGGYTAQEETREPREPRQGPVTVVRDARTNPGADSGDDESASRGSSRRADESRKEANHSSDEIPATIEGRDDQDENASISDPSDNGDRDDDRGRGRDRRGRGRDRGERGGNSRRKPREDREGGSNEAEVDQDRLRDMAWKIYKSEVCEEGLALLDPRSMREYARSSFRAARVFLEEEQSQD